MTSITQLFGDLCEAHMAGLSWKCYRGKRQLNRTQFKEKLKRVVYNTLFMNLFRDEATSRSQSEISKLPVKNKILMLSFNMRLAGMGMEADLLEELTEKVEKSTCMPQTDLNSILELLIELAGTGTYQLLPRKRDYFLNNKYVGRNVKFQGYDHYDVSLFESGLLSLLSTEDLQFHDSVQRTLQLMDAQPGTGLPSFGQSSHNYLVGDKYEKETRLSLFGALVHSCTCEMEVKLDLPAVPDNVDMTGLKIRVPQSIDQSEDEGFQSASNLTPDSQSEPSSSPDIDLWSAVLSYEPSKYRCWELIGCPPGKKERLYLTEAGREAFDKFYQLRVGQLQLISGTLLHPTPVILQKESELVKDVLNVLIGVASMTFLLNQSLQAFVVRQGVYISGTSPESMYNLLSELAENGTYYTRLSHFSLQPILDSTYNKGLVFQAFTSGLGKYLQYYRACVLSTPSSLSLLTIVFLFRKLGRQLRYLSELCGIGSGVLGLNRGSSSSFPTGVKLLSYLYKEALNNCSNEHYPVLLSLLKSSCEPYTRFVYDWVYSGICRDAYGEFMIQVNEDYLNFRDKHYWTHGYVLASKEVEECVPLFLAHVAYDIYLCGKTINLLKLCCPMHYICWSDIPVPRIAVTFSLEELEEIERDCAVYVSRMEKIARYSSISREAKNLRKEIAQQELIVQAQQTATRAMVTFRDNQLAERKAYDVKKRERFLELKEQFEKDMERRNAIKQQETEKDLMEVQALKELEERRRAYEEELEKRARQQLIEHYSNLSEEAARREQKALWKIQRHKLESARIDFLLNDQRKLQITSNENRIFDLKEHLIAPLREEATTDVAPVELLPFHDGIEPPTQNDMVEPGLETSLDNEPQNLPQTCNLNQKEVCLLDMSFEDFLPKEQLEPYAAFDTLKQTTVLDEALKEIGSELSNEKKSKDVVKDEYDFSIPSAASVGAQYKRSVGKYTSQIDSQWNSRSDTHIKDVASDSKTSGPHANIYGHVSDSNLNIGEWTSNVEHARPRWNIHGHASESNIKVGEYVSNIEPSRPRWNIHGHASESNIKVGDYVSNTEPSRPRWNIHGHASQANMQIGEYVSDVEQSWPKANIHGHASQATIQIGDYVPSMESCGSRWNIHGHLQQLGKNVSYTEPSEPQWKKPSKLSHTLPKITESPVCDWTAFGHPSQSNFRIGEWSPDIEANLIPKQKTVAGHASDSTIQDILYNKRSQSEMVVPDKADEKLNVEIVCPTISKEEINNTEESKLITDLPHLEPELKGNENKRQDELQDTCEKEITSKCTEEATSTPPLQTTCFQDEKVNPLELQKDCFQERNAHGGQSDSTPIDLLYTSADLLNEAGRPLREESAELSTWEKEQAYLKSLADQYCVEHYQDNYELMSEPPISHLLQNIVTEPCLVPLDPSVRRATDATAVQASSLVSLPVLMKHSITAPLIAQASLVNKSIIDYLFVELNIEQNFEALRHFLLMEDGEFAQSLSDLLFEKLGSGQTPGELLNPLVLNSILNKALQYSLHGDSVMASNLTFALKYLPEMFKPNAPDALNCLELRYKVNWPLNIVITESCMNKYNKIFSFLLQLKHMVWTLKDVWFHLKRTGELYIGPAFVNMGGRVLKCFSV